MPSLASLIEISKLEEIADRDHSTVHSTVLTEAGQAERPSRLQGNLTCGRRSFQSYLDSHDEELEGWKPDDSECRSVKRNRTNQLFKELQVNFLDFDRCMQMFTLPFMIAPCVFSHSRILLFPDQIVVSTESSAPDR